MEDHRRYEKLIDEMILGDEPGDWQELRAHLQGCPRCRERYDRVSLAERMLHGGPGALEKPSPASVQRIGAAVLDGAAPRPSAWSRALAWVSGTQAGARQPGALRWAAGVATVAAMAVLIPFFVLRPHAGDEFQARGGPTNERQAGVRAFCLDGGGVTARCSRSAQLRLTISNAGAFKYVFLVGLDELHAEKWYAPRPPELLSVAAPSGIDVPVGDGVRLGVNHDPGAVRVYALFSDQPINAAEIESAVDKMKSAHQSPSATPALPLDRRDVVQHSITFDVAP